MNFLQQRLGPFPMWVWAGIVVGGVGIFFLVRHMQSNNSSGSTLGQNPTGQVNPLNQSNDPNIDPNTGIPYQIEEMIDPNTGLPYYIELTSGATSQGQAGGGPGGSTAPIPPGPGTAPGTAPSTSPIPPQPGTAPHLTAQAGGPIPPQPGTRKGPIPPQPGTAPRKGPIPPQPGTAPRRGPIPPQPGEGKHPIPPIGTGEEWDYPFWAGQGGILYSRM